MTPFEDSTSRDCTAPSLPSLRCEVRKFEHPMGHTAYSSVKKAIEEAMWATPGLEKAEILQDTRSCVVPRPSEDDCTKSSHRTAKRYLGVLGTSLVNVERDLAMAAQGTNDSRLRST